MDNDTEQEVESDFTIQDYYLGIIDSMPNAVYWIDADCNLQGCNKKFLQLFNIPDLTICKGMPYSLFIKYAGWSDNIAESCKLDDMEVIFSAVAPEAMQDLTVTLPNAKTLHLQVTRTPLFNNHNKLIGLVVTFTPIAASAATQHEAATLASNQDLPPLAAHKSSLPRVLMVEDNMIAQKVGQNLLQTLGCEVDIAETGEDALKIFVAGKYDIIFMDIGLQDTSGYIVSKKIRELEQNSPQHVPIIALTSYKAEVVKQDCRDYFMAGAITKPLTMHQAEQIIQHYIYAKDVLIEGLVSA